jgi:hypothetical protein
MRFHAILGAAMTVCVTAIPAGPKDWTSVPQGERIIPRLDQVQYVSELDLHADTCLNPLIDLSMEERESRSFTDHTRFRR